MWERWLLAHVDRSQTRDERGFLRLHAVNEGGELRQPACFLNDAFSVSPPKFRRSFYFSGGLGLLLAATDPDEGQPLLRQLRTAVANQDLGRSRQLVMQLQASDALWALRFVQPTQQRGVASELRRRLLGWQVWVDWQTDHPSGWGMLAEHPLAALPAATSASEPLAVFGGNSVQHWLQQVGLRANDVKTQASAAREALANLPS